MEYTTNGKSLPVKRPVHYVRAWSGNKGDESPICGADRLATDVWG